MASRYLIIVAITCLVAAQSVFSEDAPSQDQILNQGFMSRLPGGQTAAGIGASSTDAMSRYFAQDGPIQPAITAIGGLPMRGAELLNSGINQISSGLHNQARSMSQAAGQNGQIQMPGLDRAGSMMPDSLSRLGQTMQNAISRKNQWIMSQADRAVDSANRLHGSMHRSGDLSGSELTNTNTDGDMSVQASGPLDLVRGPAEEAGNMLNSAQQQLSNGASQLQNQASEQLSGATGQLGQLRGAGQELFNQAQELMRTITGGLGGAFGKLQETGQQVSTLIQNNHQRNTQAITQALGGLNPMGRLSSMQQTMGRMGSDAQQRLNGAAQYTQTRANELGGELQNAAQDGMRRARDGLRSAHEGIQPPIREAQQTARQLSSDLQRTAQESSQAAQRGMQSAIKTAQDGIERAREGFTAAQQGVQPPIEAARETAQHLGQGMQRTAQEGLKAAERGFRSSVNTAQNGIAQAQTSAGVE